uniref:E3 ubiquitin-protein ligase RNF31-like n=1 Tax=Pristiophorus japonicus TaxID=55135 RepID=UPI00398E3CF7
PLDLCCAVCSKDNVAFHCQKCCSLLCAECDGLFHRHPTRVGHQRVPLPIIPPASEGPIGLPASETTPLAASPLQALPVLAAEPEEAARRAAKPGLGRRSVSAEQHGYWPSLPRPDRRPSDTTASAAGLPRPPWTCASCSLDNGARAVLCGGCERPRASRAPGAGAADGGGAGRPAAPPPSPRGSWECRACTFHNEPTSVLCCACDRPRLAGRPSFAPGTQPPAAILTPAPTPPAASDQVAGWECQHCTFRNRGLGRICEVCDRTSAHGPEADPHPKILKLEERPQPPGEGAGGPGGAAAGGGGATAAAGRAAELARQEDMRAAGLRLVHMIRLGEEKHVAPEEVSCALRCSGKDDPLQWLQAELPQVLETIAELASQQGEAAAENQVGSLTCEEARQAWLASGGHFEEAVQECVRVRAKKVREIRAMGFANRYQVLQALYMNGGNVDKAIIDLQRHQLEPFHAQIWQEDEAPIQLGQADKQRVLRQILATYNLPSWGRAEIVLSLMQEGIEHCEIHDVVEAVKESQDKEFIKRMLSLTCLVCLSLLPQMQSVTSCECTICRDCFKDYFTFTVREKHIKKLVCPGCAKPDIDDEGQLLSYFSTLDVQLRDCLDVDVYNLFHKKLTERTLMKDPNFKWCTHCSNGFIYDGNQSRVTCPQCKGSFCVECKRPWEQQHQGISCEDFQNWKRENDPEYQAQGLAAYLKENGIDCPNCKFRYALAKGGCMHFKCSQCQHEFCSGCYNTFLAKNKCTDPVCLLRDALHAHHPRDCLSYLRDWPVDRLQALLQNHKVNFDKDPPTGAEPTPGGQCLSFAKKLPTALGPSCSAEIALGFSSPVQTTPSS